MDNGVLERGLPELGVAATAGTVTTLVRYLELIAKWNKVYNLTAIQDRQRMAVDHILDSLAIAPRINPDRILDIGSGAGLPGIPLAIVCPQWSVTLLDASHKRCAFLRQAVIELGLRNAEIVCERIETYRPMRPFDTVVSRAFAETALFARVAVRCLAPSGVMLAMKGIYPHDELAKLPDDVLLNEVAKIDVPYLGAQRHLVIMTKALT
jgi:16S rRNA (guanine527-N7)-methyltransferase